MNGMRRPAALSYVKAVGSLRHGAYTWLAERLTSVGLVPLALWFIYSAISLSGASYDEVRVWLGQPLNTTFMLLTVVSVFLHSQLGVRVILDDYVHREPLKFACLVANNFIHLTLAVACTVAVLKVSLGS